MSFNGAAMKMKEGIRSGFNTFCKTMGDYKIHAVGLLGGLMYVTKAHNDDINMIKDKLVEQNKQIIDLEMQVIMQGDATAAASASAKVEASSEM